MGNDASEKLVTTKGHVSSTIIEGLRRSNRRRPFSKRLEHFLA